MSEEAQCSKCSGPLTPDTRVHLWDGKDYCHDCVEDACPGLADYARDHTKLEEQAPYDRKAVFLRTWWSILAICVLFLLPPGISGHWAPWKYLLALVFGCIPFAALTAFSTYLWERTYRSWLPTVTAKDGRVTICYAWPRGWRRVLYGPRLRRRERSYDLTEVAAWRTTKAWTTQSGWLTPELRATIIVIVVRWTFLGFEWTHARIPCGWSPEMRRRWEGLLSLAAPRQRHTRARTDQPIPVRRTSLAKLSSAACGRSFVALFALLLGSCAVTRYFDRRGAFVNELPAWQEALPPIGPAAVWLVVVALIVVFAILRGRRSETAHDTAPLVRSQIAFLALSVVLALSISTRLGPAIPAALIGLMLVMSLIQLAIAVGVKAKVPMSMWACTLGMIACIAVPWW